MTLDRKLRVIEFILPYSEGEWIESQILLFHLVRHSLMPVTISLARKKGWIYAFGTSVYAPDEYWVTDHIILSVSLTVHVIWPFALLRADIFMPISMLLPLTKRARFSGKINRIGLFIKMSEHCVSATDVFTTMIQLSHLPSMCRVIEGIEFSAVRLKMR